MVRSRVNTATLPTAADALAAASAAGIRIDTLETQLHAISGQLQTLITAAAASGGVGVGGGGGASGGSGIGGGGGASGGSGIGGGGGAGGGGVIPVR